VDEGEEEVDEGDKEKTSRCSDLRDQEHTEPCRVLVPAMGGSRGHRKGRRREEGKRMEAAGDWRGALERGGADRLRQCPLEWRARRTRVESEAARCRTVRVGVREAESGEGRIYTR
jgi:hypothetical protein